MEITRTKKKDDCGLTPSTRAASTFTTLSSLHDSSHVISTRVILLWLTEFYHNSKYALYMINVPMVIS